VPSRLAELLYDGSLGVAVMAKADGFEERIDVAALYREHFVLAFATGHRFEQQNAIR
jgi:LysR family transcriptional regulator, hydrogen peroxide-inducible genes activator